MTQKDTFANVEETTWHLPRYLFVSLHSYIQGGREISAIIVTDDYLCYKEPESPYNFFLILIFNELSLKLQTNGNIDDEELFFGL